MEIFLAWRHRRAEGSPERRPHRSQVAERLGRVFDPLFETPPETSSATAGPVELAFLRLPAEHFTPPSVQEADGTWAYAPQYPLDAAVALTGAHDAPPGIVLPALGRALEAAPEQTLRALSPPFSLLWTALGQDELLVQNDGLGHALLYEYEDAELWALTNRPFALAALGVSLSPSPEEWATRTALGWFPAGTTGFHGLTYLPPGTRLRVSAREVRRTTYDVLADWVGGPERPVQECLDLATASVLELARAVRPLVDRPTFSLSGGRDSRAVFAAVRATGLNVRPQVRGPADHADVVVARRLADAAGVPITNRHDEGVPPSDAAACHDAILRALLWQAGGSNFHQHKTFQVSGRFSGGGAVGISGQHGEIGRSSYLSHLRNRGLPAEGRDEELLAYLWRPAPHFMRPAAAEHALGSMKAALRRADDYDIGGLRRWDFFYLYERTRRWSSAAQGVKAAFSIGPFLNPGYITAAYAHPGDDLTSSPFHAHLVRELQPSWLEIPYATELAEQLAEQRRSLRPAPAAAASPSGWQRAGRRRFYDTRMYWEEVGRPVLDEVLRTDGFWTQVLDPDRAREHWQSAPDALVVLGLLDRALERAASAAGR